MVHFVWYSGCYCDLIARYIYEKLNIFSATSITIIELKIGVRDYEFTLFKTEFDGNKIYLIIPSTHANLIL